MGLSYAAGRGVSVDNAKAAEWYRKAAEQGDADAQYELGHLLN
jgi:TPR repeat protein